MSGLSSGEREYALLVAQLHALDQDIDAARALSRGVAHPRRTGVTLHMHDEPAPAPPSGEAVTLSDGAQIFIRPVCPDDRDELRVGFAHLGALSRFRRYRRPVEHLTPRQLSELCDVDHDTHEGLIALTEEGDCIGAARFVRDPRDPTRAEFTCTVVDAWQRRGVGTALAERLAARARALGVEHFVAVVLVGNEPARRLVHRIAGDVTEHREGGEIEITDPHRERPR
jgi:RimJ/RimL family protein N-acetyltransferase